MFDAPLPWSDGAWTHPAIRHFFGLVRLAALYARLPDRPTEADARVALAAPHWRPSSEDAAEALALLRQFAPSYVGAWHATWAVFKAHGVDVQRPFRIALPDAEALAELGRDRLRTYGTRGFSDFWTSTEWARLAAPLLVFRELVLNVDQLAPEDLTRESLAATFDELVPPLASELEQLGTLEAVVTSAMSAPNLPDPSKPYVGENSAPSSDDVYDGLDEIESVVAKRTGAKTIPHRTLKRKLKDAGVKLRKEGGRLRALKREIDLAFPPTAGK